jgi:peptidoglycan/LPS O-acetylase OafA/YrhL
MPALDGLRGVAILMVLLTHVAQGWKGALSIYQDTTQWGSGLLLPDWFIRTANDAAYGVQLFFVVSAYTLTRRALHGRHHNLRAYALRRIARVGPGYWLAAIAYTMAAGLAPRMWAPGGVHPIDLGVAAIFASAWQGGAALAVVPGGWSVSTEVTFYIALPALLWAIDGRLPRAVTLTTLAIAVAQLRVHYPMAGLAVSGFLNPIQYAPVFLFGITAALVASQMTLPRMPTACLTLLAFAIVGLPQLPIPAQDGLSLLSFAAVVTAVVILVAADPPTILTSPVMRRIGEVSYSMYLIHFAVLAPSLSVAVWLFPVADWRATLLHMVLTTAVSFWAACITYRFVECPAIRWAARSHRRPVCVTPGAVA